VVQAGAPLMTAPVSPLTNPVIVASRGGLGVPNGLVLLLAVTVSVAFSILSVPATAVKV
jgi:hypothetical protein